MNRQVAMNIRTISISSIRDKKNACRNAEVEDFVVHRYVFSKELFENSKIQSVIKT